MVNYKVCYRSGNETGELDFEEPKESAKTYCQITCYPDKERPVGYQGVPAGVRHWDKAVSMEKDMRREKFG